MVVKDTSGLPKVTRISILRAVSVPVTVLTPSWDDRNDSVFHISHK